MTEKRFAIVEGSYRGTSDDVAGRWYIVDRDGDYIDKRGNGLTKAVAKLEAKRLNEEYPDKQA